MERGAFSPFDRRALARALTRAASASVAEVLQAMETEAPTPARRIGVTGPPGAGKSTLAGSLARHRIGQARQLAVVAVDPTSPVTQGSVLGDRIRMDAIADDPRIYIRSLSSGQSHDGLTDNLPDVLAVLERFGFDEIILETVGVGQAEYGVRALVDTEVLVLVPESGDQIQAMKAGILETADVYVINKADLPGASRLAAEILGVLEAHGDPDGGYRPPVLFTCMGDPESIAALSAAIDRHLAWAAAHRDPAAGRRERNRFRVRALLHRRMAEVLAGIRPEELERPAAELYRIVLERATGGQR